MPKKKQTYTNSITELESIIEEINSGGVPIDELQKKVQRAKELLVWCQNMLRATQEEIENNEPT